MIYCQRTWSHFLFYHCCVKINMTTVIFRGKGGVTGGWELVSEYKVSSGWFSGAVTVNLFTHNAESLAHLDNTVNSNQDPVILNYIPWAVGGVMKWHMWAAIYLQHLPLCRVFIPEHLFYWRDVQSRAEQSRASLGDCLPSLQGGHIATYSLKSVLMPLTIHYTAQAHRYIDSILLQISLHL